MTTEYTPGDIAMILRCLRAQTEGPGPICPVCVHQAGLVAYDEQSGNRITDAGRVVLAIAAERDRVLREITEILGTCEPTADSVIEAVRDVDRIHRELNQREYAHRMWHGAIVRAICEADEQYKKDADP